MVDAGPENTALESAKPYKMVYVEITNGCNLACSFCPGNAATPAFMDCALFSQIAAQISPLTEQVYLHVLGEPLLHPDLFQMLNICREFGLKVAITTNGTLIDSHTADLLHSSIRQINVSLHSALQLGVDHRARYLAVLEEFVSEVRRKRPELYINLRLWNQFSRSDEVEPAAEDVMSFLSRVSGETALSTWATGTHKSRRLVERIYLHRDTRFEWPAQSTALPTEKGFCHGLGTHFAVLVDGTVVPCCLDSGAAIALGNCRSESILNILNGPRATAIVQGFRKNTMVERLCQQCSYARRFKRGSAAPRRGVGGNSGEKS